MEVEVDCVGLRIFHVSSLVRFSWVTFFGPTSVPSLG